MTPAEHYAEAEWMLKFADSRAGRSVPSERDAVLAQAQVHAILAHAGAISEQEDAIRIHRINAPSRAMQWRQAFYGSADPAYGEGD